MNIGKREYAFTFISFFNNETEMHITFHEKGRSQMEMSNEELNPW